MTDHPPERSRFTRRHLNQLSNQSADCPLRVVAHIDLDAFYAQCEMKRLGVPKEVPLAVKQWDMLIAVNYAARAKGVSRHMSAKKAKEACPDIKLVHVAVLEVGEPEWKYSSSNSPSIAHCKASLDPYRIESKKILGVISRSCPGVTIEKASIDESFLDLSKVVHGRLLAEHEELRELPADGDLSKALPLPRRMKLDWSGSRLVSRTNGNDEDTGTEEEAVDWDDVAVAIGANIVKNARTQIFEELSYTCSGGVANNKMLAKLGSAFRKPNQQSVVRTSAIQAFMSTMKFTQIRHVGGNVGDKLTQAFGFETVKELLGVELRKLASVLDDSKGTLVYHYVRGIDTESVSSRVDVQSVGSNKTFQGRHPASLKEVHPWLRLFVADIKSRLDFETDGRQPKKITVSYENEPTKGAVERKSKTADINWSGESPSQALFRDAELLLKELDPAYPLKRVSVSVSQFKEREKGNRDISAFFTKGGAAEPGLGIQKRLASTPVVSAPPKEVKRSKLNTDNEDSESFVCPECRQKVRFLDVEAHSTLHKATKKKKPAPQHKNASGVLKFFKPQQR